MAEIQRASFGVGIATVDDGGAVLDTRFPVVNVGENEGFIELVTEVCGADAFPGTVRLDDARLRAILARCEPHLDAGGAHPNAEALRRLLGLDPSATPWGTRRVPVITVVGSLASSPEDAHDVYLRLHLLSHRRIRPHGSNLDGIFGLLSNVAWTELGPVLPERLDDARWAATTEGRHLVVHGIDKFPRMVDYVVPPGVRIADASRVRLGAHLGDGTTVMHEGFVNFNAGTLGPAMVEGRISAGVVVGEHTDIGGGASIMGTLSGGGTEVISVGQRCLIGANGGIGISLGDDCTVEAGLYVTAGTRVTLPDGTIVKAGELSGRSGLLYRRNSTTGTVEVLPTRGTWSGLNAELHSNN